MNYSRRLFSFWMGNADYQTDLRPIICAAFSCAQVSLVPIRMSAQTPHSAMTHSALLPNGSAAKDCARTNYPVGIKIAILLAALMLVATIGYFSPNFKTSAEMRTQPLGGDLLQEWTGGYLVLNGAGSQLYDLEQFKKVQHDADLLGFSWDSQKYFPPVYPPFYYTMVSPIALVSYPVAIWIGLFINGLCLGLLCLLGSELTGRAPTFGFCCLGVLALFTPVILCLTTGQKSLVLLLILCGSYWLLKNNRSFAAGVVFGLIAFKPHLALLIGVTMLLKRQWSFVAGAILMAAVFGVVSLLMGVETCSRFVEVCMGMTDYVSSGGYQLTNSHSLWGSYELLFGSFGSTVVKVCTAISGIAVIAVVGWILQGELKPASDRFALQFSALIIGTVLLSPHFYFYDLTILLLPVLLISMSLQGNTNRTTVLVNSLSIGFVVLASQFSRVADWTGVQPSIFLMIAFLVCIAIIVSRSSKPKSRDVNSFDSDTATVRIA